MTSTASRQEPPPVHLRVVLRLPEREDREFSYDFKKAVISLGRDPSNDIQIPLTTVSRSHSRIFFEMGDYFLEDLGSTHGTHHNGSPVGLGEKRLLRDGDEIRVMSFYITFKTTARTPLDRQPGEKTEHLARRMVQEVLSSLGAQDAELPALRVMNGPDEGKRFELNESATEVVLGRNPDCDCTLNDANVSRRHCLIKREWHGFTAQDLGSKNGVLINGRRTEGAELIKDGDIIQIGGVKLTFLDPPSRLLDQMGGLEPSVAEPEVIQPEGPSEVDRGSADSSPDLSSSDDESGIPDFSDSPAEMQAPPIEEPIEVPEEVKQAAQATKEGGAWDLIILVLGGLFLTAAVGLVVFLLM